MLTGFNLIDDDHKVLYNLIDRISYSAQSIDEVGKIPQIIDALNEYADGHFQREEVLMSVCGYQALPRHQQEHGAFTVFARALKHLYHASPALISIEGLTDYLTTWLRVHISITDHAYISHMRSHKELIEIASINLRKKMRNPSIGGNAAEMDSAPPQHPRSS